MASFVDLDWTFREQFSFNMSKHEQKLLEHVRIQEFEKILRLK